MTETYGVIQVKGGKFHRPFTTTHERMAWVRPMLTACSVSVTPLNVFSAVEGALEYTGGRREYLCRKCFPAIPAAEQINAVTNRKTK